VAHGRPSSPSLGAWRRRWARPIPVLRGLQWRAPAPMYREGASVAAPQAASPVERASEKAPGLRVPMSERSPPEKPSRDNRHLLPLLLEFGGETPQRRGLVLISSAASMASSGGSWLWGSTGAMPAEELALSSTLISCRRASGKLSLNLVSLMREGPPRGKVGNGFTIEVHSKLLVVGEQGQQFREVKRKVAPTWGDGPVQRRSGLAGALAGRDWLLRSSQQSRSVCRCDWRSGLLLKSSLAKHSAWRSVGGSGGDARGWSTVRNRKGWHPLRR